MPRAIPGIGKGLATAIVLLLLGATAGRADSIAFTGGKIVPVVGDVIENGTLLVENGKIVAMGTEVDLPFDAEVVDATGKTLFPGFVLAYTSAGLDVANENLPVTPFVDVYDSLDPSSLFFEDALRRGMTSIGIFQGDNTVIGGMGRVVRPVGLMVEEMTVAPDAGLTLSMTPKRGYDPMVQSAELREAFDELTRHVDEVAEKKYEEELEEKEEKIAVMPDEAAKKGRELIDDGDVDDKHRNLYRLADGRLSAMFHASSAMDAAKAVEFAREHGFLDRTTFVLGSGAYKALDAIAASKRPVVLDPNLVHRDLHPITGEESFTFVPGLLAEKKVPFALTIDPNAAFAERYLPWQAARCVAEGIDRDTAIAAITTVPAGILGIEDRVGSFGVGKDANVLVLSGDPLDLATMVEQVFIAGTKVYDITEDRRLENLMKGRTPDMGVDEEGADGQGAESEESESDGAAEAEASGDESKEEKKD